MQRHYSIEVKNICITCGKFIQDNIHQMLPEWTGSDETHFGVFFSVHSVASIRHCCPVWSHWSYRHPTLQLLARDFRLLATYSGSMANSSHQRMYAGNWRLTMCCTLLKQIQTDLCMSWCLWPSSRMACISASDMCMTTVNITVQWREDWLLASEVNYTTATDPTFQVSTYFVTHALCYITSGRVEIRVLQTHTDGTLPHQLSVN